jgi:transcriptional regulator with XRE-family HTH domain
MTTLKQLKRRLLRNPGVKAEYEALKVEEKLAARLVQIRLMAGLTQKQIAARIGAKQAAVARVESGRHAPALATLEGYAAATGRKLVVDFVPVKGTVAKGKAKGAKRKELPAAES